MEPRPEISVVMPCLNEADTLARCIGKARRAADAHGIDCEIVVADNGSSDGSREIAKRCGARLVEVPERGYGSALIGGITASGGRYVLMGDADDSYDFGELPRFLERLRAGAELVQGCRLPAGGGRLLPGAMPWLHRWVGNPLFSSLARRMFRAPIHDINCGMRGFSRQLFDELDLRCTGMEFANEMIIKASLSGRRIAELPITLSPDGRVSHAPHLRTFRDGWRTLRFYLMSSPRWLFLVPGFLLVILGVLGYALAMPSLTVLGATLDVNTLLVSSLALLLGYQAILFAVFAKTIAVLEGMLPSDSRLERFWRVFGLERGLLVGAVALLLGAVLLGVAVEAWRLAGFGPLEPRRVMRLVIPGVTLTALGFQTVLSSFLLSILGIGRR